MKMHCHLLIFLLLASCTSTQNKEVATERKYYAKSELFNPSDSTHLIDSLYKNTVILNDIKIDSFNCSHNFDTITKRIEITCVAQVNKHKIGYILELTDTGNRYNESDFQPSDEFRYDNSYLILDEKKLPITQLKYSNDSSSFISPVIVWYGNGFGPVARYYQLPDKREFFLIRGLNFYCNGTHCSNYKVFILQKFKKGSTIVSCIDYPGNYPFGFENTFIFFPPGSAAASIYIIKKGKTGEQTTDFEIMPLQSSADAEGIGP